MSEKVMIDGVDVSGCEHMYDNEDLTIMCQNEIGSCFCRENKDCYYKQYWQLKEKYDTLTNKFFNSETEKTHLQTENEKKDNLLKWLITQQYYILPKNIKLKIKEVLK